MLTAISKWLVKSLLKRSTFRVIVHGDDVSIEIKYGDTTVLEKKFDLLKDGFQEA
jgi:hypothetical protein